MARFGADSVRRSGVVVAAVAIALVTGCAFMRSTDPYAPVKGYSRFGSEDVRPIEVAAVRGPLSLERCVEIALTNNPELAAEAWDVRASNERVRAARAARWPSLHAVGGYRHYLDEQRLIPAKYNGESGAFDDDIFSADVVASMPLFTGGRISSEIKSLQLQLAAARQRLVRTREDLIFQVSRTFYSILGRRRVVESLEFSQKALNEHRQRVVSLMEADKAAPVDLLRVEVRIADLEQRSVFERNILDLEHRLIANLMGLDEDRAKISIAGTLTPAEMPANQQGAVARALANRADYLAARAELEAQAKRVDMARAARWPTLTLSGSYGERWAASPAKTRVSTSQPTAVPTAAPTPAPSPSPEPKSKSANASSSGYSSSQARGGSAGAPSESGTVAWVGVSFDVPLFEWGRITARIDEERAKLAAAQQRLRRLELQLRLEVESAIFNLTSARQRIQATEKAVEQAEESFRIEQEKYAQGKGSITDVLDAQGALLDAQTNHYRALADYHVSLAQLRLAVGQEQ